MDNVLSQLNENDQVELSHQILKTIKSENLITVTLFNSLDSSK